MKSNSEHLEIAERLSTLLLQEYEKRLMSGKLSDAGLANLQKLLKDNGWAIVDEQMESIRSKLTSLVDPSDLDHDDDVVIARIG